MKYLITGVAGFIGSSIAAELLRRGEEVIGIDSFTDYYESPLKEVNVERLAGDSFRLIRADLNRYDLPSLLDGTDVVFHQAGQPGVRKSWGRDFVDYIDANVRATQALLEAAKTVGNVSRIVYASSSSVYGDAERYPTRVEDVPQPVSPYGVTKLAAEHLCTLYAKNFGVPTVSLRYFTVFGPRQRPDMAFTRFVKAALVGDPITIYGNGEQIRDFTYVDDVVAANLAAATANIAPGRVFNVAGGSNTSVNEVLEVIRSGVSRSLDVRYHTSVPGDVLRTGGDVDATIRELEWQPKVSLQDGLSRQIEWARESLVSSQIGG